MPDLQTKVLETKRLVLRRLTLEDLDALFALYRDPEVRKYFPEDTLTYEETKEELGMTLEKVLELDGFPTLLYSRSKPPRLETE